MSASEHVEDVLRRLDAIDRDRNSFADKAICDAGSLIAALSAEPVGDVTDAEIRSEFIAFTGDDEGWLDGPGSWFTEGYKKGRLAQPQRQGPLLVDSTVARHIADAMEGNRYGVDWVYHDDRRGVLSEREAFPKEQPQRQGLMSGQLHDEVVNFITDHEEDVTHQQLLALGWTPPGTQRQGKAVAEIDGSDAEGHETRSFQWLTSPYRFAPGTKLYTQQPASQWQAPAWKCRNGYWDCEGPSGRHCDACAEGTQPASAAVADSIMAHFCNAVDNLGDMPVSEDWAMEWVKEARRLLAAAPEAKGGGA